MSANTPKTDWPESNWVDPDDAPELGNDFFEHAELSIGGKVIRPASSVLTKDGLRLIGRPSLGDKTANR